jgi:hypothetical protein
MRGTAHRRNTDRPCEIPPDITIAVEPNRSHPTRLTKLAERKTVISTVPAPPDECQRWRSTSMRWCRTRTTSMPSAVSR